MTEPDNFLNRWARRKRAAAVESAETKPEKSVEPVEPKPEAQTAGLQPGEKMLPSGENKPDQIFDMSKLPSLDSIGPATDIRAFLQPGVPEALSRAALRRAWAADPGIRDFIGLSENSWDFTATDSVHGFGALDPAEAKRLLARFLGSGEDDKDGTSSVAEDQDTRSLPERAEGDASGPDPTRADHLEASSALAVSGASAPQHTGSLDVAPQEKEADSASATAPARRPHGRALPQ